MEGVAEAINVVVLGECASTIARIIVDCAGTTNDKHPPLIGSVILGGIMKEKEEETITKIFSMKTIKPFWYPIVSCFLLTFDINNPNSFPNLTQNLIPHIKQNAPFTPFFIAAWDSSCQGRLPVALLLMILESKGQVIHFQLQARNESDDNQNERQVWRFLSNIIVHCKGIKNAARIEYPSLKVETFSSSNEPWKNILSNFLRCAQNENEKKIDLAGQHITQLPHWLWRAFSSIPWLQHLDISNNNMRCIPNTIKDITSLEILDVSCNHLDSLPVTLLSLPHLKHLRYKGNPLSYFPKSCNKNTRTMLTYLRSLHSEKPWNRMKLILVGEEGVGKTTLLSMLQQSTQSSMFWSRTNNSKYCVSTDGIDVSSWSPDDTICFSCWDFAGQAIFYPTHQFFLSGRSMYLLTFNLLLPNAHRIEYWLKQIESSSPFISFVILVGTHADDPMCDAEYQHSVFSCLENRFQGKFPFIKGYYATTNNDKVAIHSLRTFITQLVSTQKLLSPLVPGSWILLDEYLVEMKGHGIQFISLGEFNKAAHHCGVLREQLLLVLSFLRDAGSLIFFEAKEDSHMIIIDPGWMSDVMSNIITLKHNWIQDGILLKKHWKHIWPSYHESLHQNLFDILKHFEIVYSFMGDIPRALIPSLLPIEPPSGIIEKLWIHNDSLKAFLIAPQRVYRYGRIWKFSFLPLGIFARCLIRLLQISDTEVHTIWRYGILLQYHNQMAYLTYREKENTFDMEIRSTQPGLPFLMSQILDTIDSLIGTMYALRVDQRQILVPCSHCLQADGPLQASPFLFPLDDLIFSLSKGHPFVYCNNLLNRKVYIDVLAPDMAFGGIPTIPLKDIIIDKEIAQGGFGRVYKGRLHEKIVAIKELLNDTSHTNDNDAVEMFTAFQREAQIMSCLQHPNLVDLIGVTAVGSPMYMVMEYIPGGTLFQLLHSDGDLDWPLRTRIAYDIAKGMNYLHSITPPLIHRDLRSPNILIDSLNTNVTVAKVADFGMTCRCVSETGGSLTTWQWHSPEVLNPQGPLYNEKIDVYSFAIVLWEIASRNFPFEEFKFDPRFCRVMTDDAGETHHVFRRVLIKEYVEQHNLRPTIPVDVPILFSSLIKRCWSTLPEDRPSFEEIVRLLSEDLDVLDECDPELFHIASGLGKRISYQTAFLPESEEREAMEESGEKLFEYSHSILLPSSCNPLCMVVSNGSVWCGCDTGDILIWNSSDLKLVKSYKPHMSCIYSLLVVGDTVWASSEACTIFIFDITEYIKQYTITTNDISIRHLALDERKGVQRSVWSCSAKGSIQRWDTETFQCIQSVTLDVERTRFILPVVDTIWVAADNSIMLLSNDLLVKKEYKAHNLTINQLLLTEQTVWSCSNDSSIAIWDLNGDLIERKTLHREAVHCLYNIGCYIVSTSSDETIIIWDKKERKPLQELEGYHNGSVRSVVAIKGSLWSACFDKSVAVWNVI